MNAGRRRVLGLSLIELMIATALSAVMTLALGTFMLEGTRSGREDINAASMLDELGYATSLLTADLEMAGFWAQIHDPSAIELDGTLALGGTDCGPAGWYQDLDALQLLDNNTGAAGLRPLTAWACLDADDVMPGTDVIAIKRVLGRVAGTDTSSAGMRAGMIYLRSHEKTGRLYLHGGTPGAVATPYENWQYAPAVYYVQRWSVSASESPQVPSLCRRVLRVNADGDPELMRECVARGIENLQLEIGVDSDEDGAANYFTPSPDATDLSRAATARLYLQIRSMRPDYTYVNTKTYQIGNTELPYTPTGDDAHYFRKTLSTEVSLRNPRALQGVAVQ
jgi:type IV pilus assembly protein PilW